MKAYQQLLLIAQFIALINKITNRHAYPWKWKSHFRVNFPYHMLVMINPENGLMRFFTELEWLKRGKYTSNCRKLISMQWLFKKLTKRSISESPVHYQERVEACYWWNQTIEKTNYRANLDQISKNRQTLKWNKQNEQNNGNNINVIPK